MSLFDRVSWKEGMFMLPQHFQQLERSLLAAGPLARARRTRMDHGVVSLELDEAAIDGGRVTVTRCAVVLPDGTAVDVPGVDAAPPSRTVEPSNRSESLDIYLALPLARQSHPASTTDAGRTDVPYIEQEQEVGDALDPARSRPIRVNRRNLRLLVGRESSDGYVALKIAEVIRGEDGRAVYNSAYIPPCLFLAGSPALMRRSRMLVGAVAARAASMTQQRRQRVDHFIELSPSDISSFLFLQTLSSHVGPLQHLVELGEVHPSVLYGELLRLAGALAVFSKAEPSVPPPYRHDDCGGAFAAVDAQIRALLDTLFLTAYEVYELKREEDLHVGTIADESLLRSASFLLAVTADVSVEEIERQLPDLLKMTTRDRIWRLIRGAVRGVEIVREPRPPSGLPISGEAAFFRVKTTGEHWEAIRRAGEVVAYASPVILPGLTMRAVAIRNDRK